MTVEALRDVPWSQPPASVARSNATIQHLEDLLELEHDALQSLYVSARAPAVQDVKGDLKGRMLAVPLLPDWLTRGPRAWARTGSFPWRGKSFQPLSGERGEGINRVLSNRWRLFRFTTQIAPSRHDGAPAFELDYDHASNPWFIRSIEDEIRELSTGLYLGQAYWRSGREGRRTFVLWFGLERRQG